MLIFSGFKGTTLVDFPGKIASLLYLSGCNMRCPYCHNGVLVNNESEEVFSEPTVLALLEKRKTFIDGVAITGGEPLLHTELKEFLIKLKAMNLKIKIDTNGLLPERIEDIFEYVDYFAMDLKTVPLKYALAGVTWTNEKIEETLKRSIKLISRKDSEFRTTLYPPFVNSIDEITEMIKLLPENSKYVIQRFIPDNAMDETARNNPGFTKDEFNYFVNEVKKRFPERFIDSRGG